MYILDTNILIELIRGNQRVIEKIEARYNTSQIYTTIISIAELYYGAFHSTKVKKQIELVKKVQDSIEALNLDDLSVVEYGKIKSQLRKTGLLIPDNDLFIASICIAQNGILVTNNIAHFERIEGLVLEDWIG